MTEDKTKVKDLAGQERLGVPTEESLAGVA